MRYPVSFSQQRLWFLDQLAPGEPTYNMPYVVSLDGPLDPTALQRAMDALVARQAVLRTRIVALDGVPEQIVDDTGSVPIEHIELPATLDDDQRAKQGESIAVDLGSQTFDLATGPLLRATLINAGPSRHLLVLVMHHIISDGESMKILMDELSAFYRAEVGAEPVSLPPLWMDYGDYAVWQRDIVRGEALERLLGYWRQQLHRAPPVLALPADRARPARLSSRGAVTKVTIDAATSLRLGQVAGGVNATMFMVFLAGFVAVLSRYTRQTDIVTGTQVAGRTHRELDPILGMFTNTLPLRISLAGTPSFTELLTRVRDTTLDALSHEQIPFEKLVDEFVPDRSLGQWPLIQVQFVYGSLTPPTLDLPGVSARTRALLTRTSKLDLTVYADTQGSGAQGSGAQDGGAQDGASTTLAMEYATDVFSQAWAERFLGCVAQLLAHAAHSPETAVVDLPLLSPAERDALIIGRNTPPADDSGIDAGAAAGMDSDVDVRQLMATATSSVVDSLSVPTESVAPMDRAAPIESAVPMSQVCERAARLARTLASRGVGPETLVGLCVGRGIGMLTAMLGVWWAGGAYVPLDPGFPAARLTAMAQGARLRLVITDATHSTLAEGVTGAAASGTTVICVDDPAVDAAAPLAPVAVPASALAYVIFTSGSTGQPKGVGVEHRAVRNLLASFRRALGTTLSSHDRFVAVTTLSFDIALLELLLPAVSGADLVIASSDDAREPDRLRSLIERTGATAMQATPQTWRLLDSAGGVPAGLRLRLCGGEALPSDLADRLMAPGTTLWNVYGPTETTVWSAAGVVTSAAVATDIGPPIDNTRLYVLDDRLLPVPVGVVGEVCIAGSGVARGYHARPRLTARAFQPDPFSDEPGARMYRTGDLGRWRDGVGLELIGRNDHQVKIRGFRIECGEVEAALRAHRDVRQAVVITGTRAGEPALVAYIVPRRGSAAAKPGVDLLEELRPHLRAALPDYMIPALVVALPALPLTPNAKVDRSALPAPQWTILSSSTAEHVGPRNSVEETLARIWGDLLATSAPLGVHDNLFALGGHSLTATRFVARVADSYGVALPVHQVFASPTIAELGDVISADPDFGKVAESARHAELAALSDDDLDDLLRAAIAQRNRRQASGSEL